MQGKKSLRIAVLLCVSIHLLFHQAEAQIYTENEEPLVDQKLLLKTRIFIKDKLEEGNREKARQAWNFIATKYRPKIRERVFQEDERLLVLLALCDFDGLFVEFDSLIAYPKKSPRHSPYCYACQWEDGVSQSIRKSIAKSDLFIRDSLAKTDLQDDQRRLIKWYLDSRPLGRKLFSSKLYLTFLQMVDSFPQSPRMQGFYRWVIP